MVHGLKSANKTLETNATPPFRSTLDSNSDVQGELWWKEVGGKSSYNSVST